MRLRARLPTIRRPQRQARSAPIDDLRAKDLLRQKAIEPRRVLGQWTVGVLSRRALRRPAGCSARLFKAMSTDDPFAAPADHIEPGPRPLYVAERFVRIDKAARAKNPQAQMQKGNKVPAWMEAMQRQREEEAARRGEAPLKKGQKPKQAPGKPPPKKAPDKNEAPGLVHTPAFGAAPAPNVDRTPPRIAPDAGHPKGPPSARPAAKPAPGAGRPRPQVPQRQRSPEVPLTPEGALDRTPPKVVPPQPAAAGRPRTARPSPSGIDRTPPRVGPAATPQPPAPTPKVPAPPPDNRPRPPAPQPTTRAPLRAPPRGVAVPGKPAGPAVDRTPPRVAHVPKDSQGAPLRTNAEIQKARKASVLGGVGEKQVAAKPPPAKPPPQIPNRPTGPVVAPTPAAIAAAAGPAPAPAPAPRPAGMDDLFAPPTPRPPPSGGLDDLFGGPTEGRAKIAPRVKKTVEAAPEEPKPAPTIDRTPPLIDRAPPLIRDAAPPKGDPEPAKVAPAKSAAPKPAPPPSGGMDDLFGAPSEGRPKVAPRAKPAAAPAAEAPKAAPPIDRTPPLLRAAPPPKAEPETAKAPPPKPGPPPTGGLDDLFGAPSEGRPKMAPRPKKTVAAVPEEPAPKPAAPAIDRAPPLIQNVDPKKLPK